MQAGHPDRHPAAYRCQSDNLLDPKAFRRSKPQAALALTDDPEITIPQFLRCLAITVPSARVFKLDSRETTTNTSVLTTPALILRAPRGWLTASQPAAVLIRIEGVKVLGTMPRPPPDRWIHVKQCRLIWRTSWAQAKDSRETTAARKTSTRTHYFPMQKREKTASSTSSTSTRPLIRPSADAARRSSSARSSVRRSLSSPPSPMKASRCR